jgi:hypothetical protein
MRPLACPAATFVGGCGHGSQPRVNNAAGEDRTPDLRIMRPTRCQLRYCRLDLVARTEVPTPLADRTLRKMTLAGLEPAIFGSEDQRLIH